MTATNHGLAGVVIAITMHRYPVLAIALAPLSHFVLDALPHYGNSEYSPKSRRFLSILGVDMILAVISTLIVALLWGEFVFLVIVCAFLAASPDLMWLWLEYIKPTDRKDWPLVASFHSFIQWSQTPGGAVIELLWFICVFGSLVYFGNR